MRHRFPLPAKHNFATSKMKDKGTFRVSLWVHVGKYGWQDGLDGKDSVNPNMTRMRKDYMKELLLQKFWRKLGAM